jgi:hypothetical protein
MRGGGCSFKEKGRYGNGNGKKKTEDDKKMTGAMDSSEHPA